MVKKKTQDWKEEYKHMSLMHTEKMNDLREANMAFDELFSRVPSHIVRDVFYELKEFKIGIKYSNWKLDNPNKTVRDYLIEKGGEFKDVDID